MYTHNLLRFPKYAVCVCACVCLTTFTFYSPHLSLQSFFTCEKCEGQVNKAKSAKKKENARQKTH